jgi:hypothetical protein
LQNCASRGAQLKVVFLNQEKRNLKEEVADMSKSSDKIFQIPLTKTWCKVEVSTPSLFGVTISLTFIVLPRISNLNVLHLDKLLPYGRE